MGEIKYDDRLFKLILKCQRNYNKPDIHSFMIDVKNGRAFVECRQYEVFIKFYSGDSVKEWIGTAIAAANALDIYGADYNTIDM